MKKIFDDYIDNSFGSEKQFEPKFEQFRHNYREVFPEDFNANVLDIGIGRGEMLTCMRNWGYKNYNGIDISPSTVKFCSGLGLNCVQVEDSAQFLLEHAERFEVITLLDVIEHIKKEEVIDFLRALRAALKVGGRLIIQTPNLQAPEGYLHRYNDLTHEVGYIEHSLAQALMAAGFKKFIFKGFEEFGPGTAFGRIRKFFRAIHWLAVRGIRLIDGNLCPKILNPVFCAIVYKNQ